MENIKIKEIPHPTVSSGRRLKPLELNNVRIGKKHTVLTPEQLEEISKSAGN